MLAMVAMSKKSTTIQISTEIRDELKSLGIKGETYDEVLRRLIKQAKQGCSHDKK